MARRKARDTAGGRRKREKERREDEEGRGSSGNSGTEFVDESVGGYRRLSRRRVTSNPE